MGCKLSSNSQSSLHIHQAIRRKSSHLVTPLDMNQSNVMLPKIFVASEACQLLHDSIEKRNEETVVHLLYNYKDEDYKLLLQCFMEEYCIDPVTLAFQNLSSSTSEIVRLRLTPTIKNISNYLNYHLRDKTTNFQARILGVILGYQELDLRELTRDYFNRYGFTLSNHLYTGFEGEILDFLKDLLNRYTDEKILEESLRQELEFAAMSRSAHQLTASTNTYKLPYHHPHHHHRASIHTIVGINTEVRQNGGHATRVSNGSLTGLTRAAIVAAKSKHHNNNNNNNTTKISQPETTIECSEIEELSTLPVNEYESRVKRGVTYQFMNEELDELSVTECVERLHTASNDNNLVEGDQFLFKILASLSRQKLKDIFENYIQKYKRDIVVDIEQSASQSYLRDLLVLSIQIIRNDSVYFANEINTLLKSTDEDSAKNYYLMFYLMTRNAESISQIKKAYRNHYFESLHDDIRSMISDTLLQSALIKALARVSSNNN